MKWCILTYVLAPPMLLTGSASRGRTKTVGRKKPRTDGADEVQDEIDGVPVTRRKFPPPEKTLPKRTKSASQLSDKDFAVKQIGRAHV